MNMATAQNVHPNITVANAGNTGQFEGSNKGEIARASQLTTEQYKQIMKMLSMNTN